MPGFVATFFCWSILYLLAGLALTGSGGGLRKGTAALEHPGAGTLLGLGMCFFAFSGFLLGWAGLRNYLPAQLGVLVLLLVLRAASPGFRRSFVAVREAEDERDPADVDWTRMLAVVGFCFLAARAAEIFYLSARWPLMAYLHDWDAMAIWGYKARVLFQQPLSAAGYFHDLSKSYSHLDYPLLLPLLESQVFLLYGKIDDSLVTALSPIIYLALLAGFHEICRGFLSRGPALFFTLLLAATEPIATQATAGKADVPLALFLLLCGGNLLLWKRTGSNARLYAGIALGCAALFTKNEGMPALVLAFLVFAIPALLFEPDRTVRARRATALGRATVLALLLAGPWLLFRSDLPQTHENYAERLNLTGIVAGLPRLPVILARFAEQVGSWRAWHLLWWLPLLGTALHPRGALSGERLQVLIYVGCMLGLYGAVYMVTPWQVDPLLQESLGRLLAHLAPLALLFTAMLAGELEGRVRAGVGADRALNRETEEKV